ncbi:MAG: Ig-like domain-containing protein [Candidatus Marinimicrobia bacterium]|nr:Ig-like domain-containing protein [Candidatus Neomarinimicrobiota bacterium]
MKRLINISIISMFLMSIATAQDLSGLKFCFDPGHGGHESDDRHMVFAEFWESESNWSKAQHVRDIFESLGATVVLTRYGNDDDVVDDPALSTRAAIANQNNVDFFQSIHSNGYNGELNYTLMLYPGPTGDPRINGLPGYPSSPIELTCASTMVNQIYSANRTTGTQKAGDWTFYGTGQPYLGVFRPLILPGVLSEGSFHDYPPETWRLKNRSYHRNEAYAIARTFVQLFDSSDFQYSTLAGIVRDSFDKVDYFSLSGSNDKYLPVNNITVTLNPGGNVYHGDSFNNGYFLFDSLAAGAYELIVEADGYLSDTAQVTIGDKFFNFKDFKLFSSIPPIVVSTIPADGDTSFPAWNPIVIQFSRPMDTALTAAAISISPEEILDFTWLNDGLKLEIRSDSLDFLSEYTITIAGTAKDIFGYQFDGNSDGVGGDAYSFTFTTGKEDMAAPQIVQMYPGQNARNVELFPVINITFDEELDTNSILDDMVFMQNYPEYDTIPTIVQHFIVNHRSVFNVFPLQELEHDKLYKVQVIAGLRDLFGNEITRKKTITFRTGVERWAIKNIDNFESGLTDNWWSPGSSGSTTGHDPATARSENTNYTNLLTNSTKSMELYYDWNLSVSSWLIRVVYKSGSSTQNIYFEPGTILQAYIFGDGSGNQFRFAIDEVGGSSASEVSKWYTIDWIGWKLVEWHFDDLEGVGSWIGNGILDGTSYRFDSIQLTHVPGAAEMGSVYFDDLRVVALEPVISVKSDELIPDKFTLYQNYPNPFNPTTNISFTIPAASNVRLDIYNVRGEKVRTLVNNYYNAGYWTEVWDGKNSDGLAVPSGVYMLRMIFDGGLQVRNMLLLK